MKPMRERITEYSKGDNLDLFWRLFRLRERSGSRLVTGLLTLVLSRMARRHGGYVGKTAVIEGFLSLPTAFTASTSPVMPELVPAAGFIKTSPLVRWRERPRKLAETA